MEGYSAQTTTQQTLTCVDIFSDCFRYRERHWPHEYSGDSEGLPPLPILERTCAIENDWHLITGTVPNLLEEIISHTGKSLQEQGMILGNHADPLFPVKGKFDTALKTCQWIVSQSPTSFIMQTRSPLALLLLPIVRQLDDRFTLTIALETLDDADALRHTPHLPRPSERLATASTFFDLGLRVHIQLAPLLGHSIPRKKIKEMVTKLVDVASFISVVPYSDIDNQRSVHQTSVQRRNHDSPFVRSACMVAEEIAKIAPDKLSYSPRSTSSADFDKIAA